MHFFKVERVLTENKYDTNEHKNCLMSICDCNICPITPALVVFYLILSLPSFSIPPTVCMSVVLRFSSFLAAPSSASFFQCIYNPTPPTHVQTLSAFLLFLCLQTAQPEPSLRYTTAFLCSLIYFFIELQNPTYEMLQYCTHAVQKPWQHITLWECTIYTVL